MSLTPSPTSATTPENSCDGTIGVRSMPSRLHVSGQLSSSKVIAAACTAISSSPSLAVGRGTVSCTNTSGPPRVCARSALMVAMTDCLSVQFDDAAVGRSVRPSVRGEQARRRQRSAQALEAHDVFVSDAHEHIVPVPEDRPAILLFDVGGLNLAFVVELVAANVDAVRVQLELLLVCS